MIYCVDWITFLKEMNEYLRKGISFMEALRILTIKYGKK